MSDLHLELNRGRRHPTGYQGDGVGADGGVAENEVVEGSRAGLGEHDCLLLRVLPGADLGVGVDMHQLRVPADPLDEGHDTAGCGVLGPDVVAARVAHAHLELPESSERLRAVLADPWLPELIQAVARIELGDGEGHGRPDHHCDLVVNGEGRGEGLEAQDVLARGGGEKPHVVEARDTVGGDGLVLPGHAVDEQLRRIAGNEHQVLGPARHPHGVAATVQNLHDDGVCHRR
mmetsp:Transcript_54518/g.173221  ORF Transcript_54518/g.173221 Transcript_54518/m.173221 type:complete len:232 (-) Transcript_54518:1000-1695(-)